MKEPKYKVGDTVVYYSDASGLDKSYLGKTAIVTRTSPTLLIRLINPWEGANWSEYNPTESCIRKLTKLERALK